jgi:1,4-alpha-glucan branching enzyme
VVGKPVTRLAPAGRAAARRRALTGGRPEQDLPRALRPLRGRQPAEGFSWIDANDSGNNVASFLRLDPADPDAVLACVANFAGHPHENYRVGLPKAGRWREVLNTDAQSYGGSGWGNMGGVDAEEQPWHGQPVSALLQLPPQGVLWLAPEV